MSTSRCYFQRAFAALLSLDIPQVRKPILAKVSAIGVAILWVTGLILVWSKWDGFGSLPQLFWVKAIFILSLTAITILINMTYVEIGKGNVALAARLPKLGPLAGISALLAVLFAVLTFG